MPYSGIYINGAGAARTIIDGNYLDNVLEVKAASYVTLNGLTLRNGRPNSWAESSQTRASSTSRTASSKTDGRLRRGGIFNKGTLSVLRSNHSLLERQAGWWPGFLGTQQRLREHHLAAIRPSMAAASTAPASKAPQPGEAARSRATRPARTVRLYAASLPDSPVRMSIYSSSIVV
jgi:hypothetical protein